MAPQAGKKPSFKVTRADIIMRILWGTCAVILGITLGAMYNADGIAAFFADHPVIYAAANAFNAVPEYFKALLEQSPLTGNVTNAGISGSGSYFALLLVAVLTALLFILRRDENVKA